jgi:lipopolysaccharide/colanic/teichoic acid biosynthesis glycosyltransferase
MQAAEDWLFWSVTDGHAPVRPLPWDKRLFDVVLASLLLLLALPVLLVAAVLIKATSPGPVLFRQVRVGVMGRPFCLWKLRTMQVRADPAAHQRYTQQWIEANAAFAPGCFKITDDPRVFAAGRWLRRYSLDELPQLFNVMRGEMSLCGPRPALPYEVARYSPRHRQRLRAVPGLTGLWQVSGRHRLSFEEMVAKDLDYIRRRSVWLDCQILWRTVRVVFFEPSY